MQSVTITNPDASVQAVFEKCQIDFGVPKSEIVGMGMIGEPTDLPRFVALTGREPQLSDQGPTWVIQIHGEMRTPAGELWTDPTCVVTANDSGWYATGPVMNVADRTITTPLPATRSPDLGLPALSN